ncbi:splicing factor YJU2-like [Gigantopelta aegis]|uniref:splicing factor YJU2-like n=1 Tax=Gigantopelta aegis TaxID=1735272 RepID=UPI001B88D331|nr:splicing factor YJU2-like [Gigantopelta aegis]
MSERKVLNKYYPPDFDPTKIPKMRMPRNQTFCIRIMAPFNMRCDTCGEYIYKGKKFNSRKENVEDEYYLGLRIFRFYIKCPRCVAEIAFKTDLHNTDYALEAGATRLFEAEKLAKKMAEAEQKEKEAEELNPMTVLENRTKASRNEMDQIDSLEELREMNSRYSKMSHDQLLKYHKTYEMELKKLQDEEEDRMVKSIFGEKTGVTVKRLADDDSDEEMKPPVKKVHVSDKPTDILADDSKLQEPKKKESWQKSVGIFSSQKKHLSGLVKKKSATISNNKTSSEQPKTSNSRPAVSTKTEVPIVNSVPTPIVNSVPAQSTTSEKVSSLTLLGNYSDSDSGQDTE